MVAEGKSSPGIVVSMPGNGILDTSTSRGGRLAARDSSEGGVGGLGVRGGGGSAGSGGIFLFSQGGGCLSGDLGGSSPSRPGMRSPSPGIVLLDGALGGTTQLGGWNAPEGSPP